MESRISAAEAARTFPELIERVRSRGEVFVIQREGRAICRIQPVTGPPRTVRDLIGLLEAVPRPDDAYLDGVEHVVQAHPTLPEGPWEQ